MAERMYKCPRCGGSVSASSGKRIKQRYFHEKCYEEKIREDLIKEKIKKEKAEAKIKKEQKKKTIEIPKAVPENEAKEREHFFLKVKELTGNSTLSAKTYALADKYKKDYKDFSWVGMEKTLIYTYQLNEYTITDDIIGIIPWKYTEANEFYESLEKIESAKKDLKDLYKPRKIKIKPEYKEKPSIDISQLGV